MDITKITKIPHNNIFIIENKELISNELCNELINYIDSATEFKIEKWGLHKNVNCKYIPINEIKEKEIKVNEVKEKERERDRKSVV